MIPPHDEPPPHPSGIVSMPVGASAAPAPALRSSIPPALALASLATQLDALLQCVHPPDCVTKAAVIEIGSPPSPMQWCGACGAIAVGDAPTTWTQPGLVRSLPIGTFEELARELERLRASIASFSRVARTLETAIVQCVQESDQAAEAVEHAMRSVVAPSPP